MEMNYFGQGQQKVNECLQLQEKPYQVQNTEARREGGDGERGKGCAHKAWIKKKISVWV